MRFFHRFHIPERFVGAARTRSRLAPLDGLRGIAILVVVWFHVWQISWLPATVTAFGQTFDANFIPETGFVGVSLFFFISGFCLFYPYARTAFDGAPRQTVRRFYARRAAKIVPSYVFFLVVLLALGKADGIHSPSDAFAQVGLHLLFIHNWFAASYGSLNGVLWSLAVEVQFYVVFPLVCALALRFPGATVGALFALALGYRLLVAPHHGELDHTMDQLPGVVDLFAAGIGTAYLSRAIAVRHPRLAARRWVWTCVALFGLGFALALMHQLYETRQADHWADLFMVWHRPLFAAAFAMLALGSLFAYEFWQRALGNPVLLFLSFVSYNVYLWHQFVARTLRERGIPGTNAADPHADPAWQAGFVAVSIVAALAVAALVTFVVERPFLRRAARGGEPTASRAARLPEATVVAP